MLYRVTRARWEDWGDDYERAERVSDAVGCELFSLDELYLADAPSRPSPWKFAAMKAVGTPSDAEVQGLVGSPGWIVFGHNGGGDRVAADLTPGPHGHAGRIIMRDHEQDVGGDLLADSLTDLVSNGLGEGRRALAGTSTGRGPGEHRRPEQCRGRRPSRAGGPVHRRVREGEAAQPRPRHRPPITRTTLEGNLGPVA